MRTKARRGSCIVRTWPPAKLCERCDEGAHELRFTNHAGTDVTYRLDVYLVMTLCGHTDTPGRWDHWPSGFVLTGVDDTGVNGRLVMDRGEIIFPFSTSVRASIDFTIREGRIVEVRRGTNAHKVRNYIEEFNDPRAWAISHIS